MLEQFNTLRDNLEEAGDNLSAHSEALGANMEDLRALHEAQASIAGSVERLQRELSEETEGLSEEIAKTRRAMRALREQFARAARRFEQFNQPLPGDGSSADGHDETAARSPESSSLESNSPSPAP